MGIMLQNTVIFLEFFEKRQYESYEIDESTES